MYASGNSFGFPKLCKAWRAQLYAGILHFLSVITITINAIISLLLLTE